MEDVVVMPYRTVECEADLSGSWSDSFFADSGGRCLFHPPGLSREVHRVEGAAALPVVPLFIVHDLIFGRRPLARGWRTMPAIFCLNYEKTG